MRTIFTVEDIKNIIEGIFNGNLRKFLISNKTIEYVNPNSEKIVLIDEDNGTQTEKDLAEYLNISFYNWKQRLVEKGEVDIADNSNLSVFEDWVQSLNFSMHEAYALVEKIDEEMTASQDIDSATITGRITFLIQADKIKNLDYYISKIRNTFLGAPQDIQNSYGEMIKSYILLGALVYDQEPIMTQLGECVIVSSNFKISYLADAQTYGDTKVEISLDGDDIYNSKGEVVDQQGFPTETKYMQMPITQYTWQNIFASQPVPTATRPDLTGFISSSLSCVKTISFYDYNKKLTTAFNDLFWSMSCIRKNGFLRPKGDVNIPVFVRITNNGNTYVFKDIIDNMEKVMTNNDFNICSITLKGWAKEIEFAEAPNIRVWLDPNGGEGLDDFITVYEPSTFEIPTNVFTKQGSYLMGFGMGRDEDYEGQSVIRVVYPTGFEMTYARLQQLYRSYGDGQGKLNMYASWVEGDIPICTVSVAEGITITSSTKPITNNGDGTYTMEMYTRLDLSWDETLYNIETSGVGDFTDGFAGSAPDKKYVIIYNETASLTLEPKQGE